MTDRPTTPTPIGQPVKCQRCNHMLGIVAPGAYWSRHAGRTLLIEGLTEAQRIRVWCESRSKENAVHVA